MYLPTVLQKSKRNRSVNKRYARSNLRFPLRHNLGGFIAGLPNGTTSWGFWLHSAFSSLYPLNPLCPALHLTPLCACLRQSQAQNSFKFNSNVTFCIIFFFFFLSVLVFLGPLRNVAKLREGGTLRGDGEGRGVEA